MFKYCIPFYYTFHSRLKSKEEKISYLFTFIAPVLLLIYLVSNQFDFILIILGFFGLMSIYEIGYLRNDIVTTKNEVNPTFRIEKKEHKHLEKKLKKIISLKYFVALFSLIFIILLSNENQFYYFLNIVLIELFYFIHNNVRNRWNLLSFFCLNNFRYAGVVLVFSSEFIWIHIIFIFVISVLRLLEKASEPKYNIEILQLLFDNKNFARVIYYLITSTVSILLFTSEEIIILSLYFLAYRVGILLLKRVK